MLAILKCRLRNYDSTINYSPFKHAWILHADTLQGSFAFCGINNSRIGEVEDGELLTATVKQYRINPGRIQTMSAGS